MTWRVLTINLEGSCLLKNSRVWVCLISQKPAETGVGAIWRCVPSIPARFLQCLNIQSIYWLREHKLLYQMLFLPSSSFLRGVVVYNKLVDVPQKITFRIGGSPLYLLVGQSPCAVTAASLSQICYQYGKAMNHNHYKSFVQANNSREILPLLACVGQTTCHDPATTSHALTGY